MKRFIIIILILLSCLPLLSLFTPGLPITHDGQDHVARIANFFASFSEGNIVPRWASNLNWGFGHPILMFLYPLPSYIASLFHSFGLSFVDSTKMVFAVSYLASILFMFFWLNDEWGEVPAFVGALLYGFAPYRFVDLYVRGALGEHVAFVFLPLILWALYGLSQNRRWTRWGLMLTLGVAGLLLSHNAISLMMIPIASLYGLYLLFFVSERKNHFFITVTSFVVLGLAVSSFFWLPALVEGKYTLRDIVTGGAVLYRMVPFSMFYYSPWNYGQGNEFTKEIGWMQWLLIFVGTGLIVTREKKQELVFLAGSLIIFFVILLFMTGAVNGIWARFMILQNFQFPWRFLTISVFLSSTIGAFVLSLLSLRWKVLIAILTVIIVLGSVHMWQPKAYKAYDESFFTGIFNSTTDTGESSPIWSVRFMESRPEFPMEIATGSAMVTSVKRTTTVRDYIIEAATTTRLVENTLYFPGWEVQVDGNDVSIEFQDPAWRGRMTFWVEPGIHAVHIAFGDTKLRKLANGISFVSIVGVSIFVLLTLKERNRKSKHSKRL